MTTKGRIAGVAAGVLAGSIDPLSACRRIVDLAGDDELQDEDILVIRGIESETDDHPGPAQRSAWDPTVLAARDADLEAYLQRVGLRDVCARLAAKWGDDRGILRAAT